MLERAAILSSATLLGVEDIEFHAAKPLPPREEPPSSMTLHEVQRDHIVRVLKLEKNNVARAAQHLGVSRSTLYDMLDRFGIERTGGDPE